MKPAEILAKNSAKIRAESPAASPPVIPVEVWQTLHAKAVEVMSKAYAPYSGYPVGAAALCDDGRYVTGCNVENAGLGVTLCAECGLVSEFVKTRGGRLVAFACVNQAGEAIAPCGRCRQLLYEHGGKDLWLAMPSGLKMMAEVLPDGFGTDNYPGVGAGNVSGADGVDPE